MPISHSPGLDVSSMGRWVASIRDQNALKDSKIHTAARESNQGLPICTALTYWLSSPGWSSK